MKPEHTIQELQNIIMTCVNDVRRYNREPIQITVGYEWYTRLNEHLRRYGHMAFMGSGWLPRCGSSYQYITGNKSVMQFHGIPMVTTHRTAVGCEVLCDPYEEALLGSKFKQSLNECEGGYHNGAVDGTIKYDEWLRRERIKTLDENCELKERVVSLNKHLSEALDAGDAIRRDFSKLAEEYVALETELESIRKTYLGGWGIGT